MAKEWLDKCERDGFAPVTIEKTAWLLARAYPLIASLPIRQITPHEALALLRKIEATGARESAQPMRSVLSRVFRYGVATVRCEKDVARDLRGAIAVPKVKPFACAWSVMIWWNAPMLASSRTCRRRSGRSAHSC